MSYIVMDIPIWNRILCEAEHRDCKSITEVVQCLLRWQKPPIN